MKPPTNPGQALDFHLGLFRQSDTERQYVAAATASSVEKQKVALHVEQMPNTFRWLQFANTYSRPAMTWDEDLGRMVEPEGGSAQVGYISDGRTYSEQEVVMTEENFSTATLQTGLAMAQAEGVLLNYARTHFITSEMRALVSSAAELAEAEALFPTDLPCDNGLIVFETPLVVDDLHPHTGEILGRPVMPIRAIGWRRMQVGARDGSGPVDGIVVINYTTTDDYNEHFVTAMDEMEIPCEPAEPGQVWPIEYHPWAFGTEWESAERLGSASEGKIVSPVAHNRRWLLSLFRVMWQRIVAPEHWKPSRQVRRSIERSRIKPTKDEEFSVLVLRRFVEQGESRKSDPDEWADWPYHYRIPVEPHWRRQHYPSLGRARNDDGSFNVESHRLIFIAAHLRGPDHLPVRTQGHVTALVR